MAFKFFRKSRRSVFAQVNLGFDRRAPRIARVVILTITGFIVANLAWAASTTVPELTRAAGEIVPNGQFQQVETFEGGVITTVLVEEGAQVVQGQLLTVLSSADLDQAERDTAQARKSVEEKLLNHHAVLNGLDTGPPVAATPPPARNPTAQGYAASRLDLFFAQQQVQLDLVVHMERSLTTMQRAKDLAGRQVEARKEPLARAQTLLKSGLTTRRELDAANDRLDEARAGLIEIEMRLAQTQQELSLAKATLRNAELTIREEFVEAVFELEQERDALLVATKVLAERRASLDVRAPESGLLHAVAFPNRGEVIAPGETLFEILPTSQGLVAQIKIQPIDIGHVAAGDVVSIKIETFDARRYGLVSGTILSISPNSVMDPVTSQGYFRTIVALDQLTIGQGQWQSALRPGMAASAEIITDERTVIAYLLKPINQSLQNAFGER
ncbi:MAG: HlyD family type I secretion membrane fusion protein [Paracoccaceae bacterium]|jgi:HlyD family type I secretion membrane fusion protein